MDAFVIQGGTRLSGEVTLSGAKNAALPIMAACLLTREEVILRGVPDLADIQHLIVLLTDLGAVYVARQLICRESVSRRQRFPGK